MGQTISISNDTNVCIHVSLKHLGPLVYQNYLRPGERMVRNVAPGFYTIEAKLSLRNNVYTEKEKIIPLVGCAVAGVALVGVAAGAAAIAIAGSTAEAAAIAGTSAAAASAGASTAGASTASVGAATVAASSGSAGVSAATTTATVAARTAIVGRAATVARSAATIARKLPVATKVCSLATTAWYTMIRRPEVQTAELVELQNRLNKLSLFKMGILVNKSRNRFVIRGGPPAGQVQIPDELLELDQIINFDVDFSPLELVTISDSCDEDLRNPLVDDATD